MKEQKTSPHVISPMTLIVILSVSLVGMGLLMVWYRFVNAPEPVACTLEAKLCPDGSVVGRSGPKCEFSACPTFVPESEVMMQAVVVGESNKLQKVGVEIIKVVTNVEELREVYHMLYDEVCYPEVNYVKRCEGIYTPVVDWTKEVVVVLARSYPMAGNEMNLEYITWNGKKPVINFKTAEIGKTCRYEMRVTTPFKIIKLNIPKAIFDEFGYSFTEERITKECMLQSVE